MHYVQHITIKGSIRLGSQEHTEVMVAVLTAGCIERTVLQCPQQDLGCIQPRIEHLQEHLQPGCLNQATICTALTAHRAPLDMNADPASIAGCLQPSVAEESAAAKLANDCQQPIHYCMQCASLHVMNGSSNGWQQTQVVANQTHK